MAAAVIAVGDVLLDVDVGATPGSGERRHTAIRVRAGGSAVNSALAAARAGVEAMVVGRVGEDAAAGIIRSALAAAGVAHALGVDPDRPTGTAVALAEGGVAADPGASASLAAADIPERLEAATVLVSGYVLLAESPSDGAKTAIERADARWLAVNLASANLVRLQGPAETVARADRANVILANADEALALTGAAPAAAARTLARDFDLVCVTAGATGAVVASGDELHEARPPAPRQGEAWGAGDAFAGTFLAALAQGRSLPDALAAAVAAA